MNNLAILEVVMAIFCVSLPFSLIYAAWGKRRGTISDYYNLPDGRDKFFYMPLTAGAILFMVNGVMANGPAYSLWLGIALLGLTFFDEHNYGKLHTFFAIIFFLGNPIVHIIYGTDPAWLSWGLFGIILIAFAGTLKNLKWYSVFWAESISCWVIGYHLVRGAMW